jgi:fructose-1,6-bisphosphatase
MGQMMIRLPATLWHAPTIRFMQHSISACSWLVLHQGEDQKKLDVLANEVFINVLKRCGQCSVLV